MLFDTLERSTTIFTNNRELWSSTCLLALRLLKHSLTFLSRFFRNDIDGEELENGYGLCYVTTEDL